MAESKNSILLLDDGSGKEVECYYRTSTENIIDFVQAVNNLIQTAQANTVFSGTTVFENIHVTGTSQLDGNVTTLSPAIIDNDIEISKGNIKSQRYDVLIDTNSGSYIKLNKMGGWELCSKYADSEIQSMLSVNAETNELRYSDNAVFEKNINILGNITSPVIRLPYTTISSDHLTTTISTPSGGNIKIPNSNSAIQITTKSGKVFKVEDNGTVYIDNKQLLTKAEMMALEHPIGSVYFTLTDTNPSSILGIGTWQKIGTGYKLAIVGTVKDKNGTSHTTAIGANTDGEWSHGITEAELAKHHHSGSATGGAHNHTGSTNTTGNHYHGSMGENTNQGSKGPYGLYADGNKYVGTNGGIDWDNSIWKTSTDGNHSHTVTIPKNSSQTHSHTVTIGDTGSGTRHNNIEPAFGIYLWKRTA